MATYCYIDLDTGERFTSEQHGLEKTENVKRDYKAEGVGINLGELRRERELDPHDQLPTAREFATEKDPDGQKGLRRWRDEHSPRTKEAARVVDKYLGLKKEVY